MASNLDIPDNLAQDLHRAAELALTSALMINQSDPSLRCSRSVQDAWSQIIEGMWPVFQRQARAHNALYAATARIPPEVLCGVFEQLSFDDRVVASHICHEWRNVFLDNPACLWSSIPPLRGGCLDALLRRTDTPVALELVGVSEHNPDETVSLLRAHAYRIKRLGLRFIAQIGDICGIFSVAAPMLEHLVLCSINGNWDALDDDFLDNISLHAPRLSTLKLRGISLGALVNPQRVFPSIRTFYCDTREWGDGLIAALASLPNLATLALFTRSPGHVGLPTIQQRSLPTLRCLMIEAVNNFMPSLRAAFEPLKMSEIPTIHFLPKEGSYIYHLGPWRFEYTSMSAPAQSLEIAQDPAQSHGLDGLSKFSLRLYDRRRRCRLITLLSHTYVVDMISSCFDHLRSLTLPLDFQWSHDCGSEAEDVVFPTLHELRALVILQNSHGGWRNACGKPEAQSVCPDLDRCTLACPVLRHLSYCGARDVLDVVEYLRDGLRYGDRKLSSILLLGSSGQNFDLSALQQFADSVEERDEWPDLTWASNTELKWT